MPRFVSAHPAVRIRIQVDSLEVLGRALRQRALDLVVDESTILEGDESIDIFEPCEPIKGYLFVRAGHPLAASNVSLRDALDYPLIQISRLPPRVLRPLLEALGPSSTAGLSRPVPEIDCPTVPLAVATVIGSDAAMMASLGMMKHELELGRVVPVFHESWMRTRRAFMKLRHRSHSPAATAFLAARRPCGERGGRRDAPKAMATALAAACGAGQRGLTGQARQAEPVRHRTLSTFCSSSRRIVHALASSFPQPGGKVER
jgi:hypothetical protein